jgi:hypothetical protein
MKIGDSGVRTHAAPARSLNIAAAHRRINSGEIIEKLGGKHVR